MAFAFVDNARMVRAWLLRVYYGCLSLLLLEHQGHWNQPILNIRESESELSATLIGCRCVVGPQN
jgi:hypothetical protein